MQRNRFVLASLALVGAAAASIATSPPPNWEATFPAEPAPMSILDDTNASGEWLVEAGGEASEAFDLRLRATVHALRIDEPAAELPDEDIPADDIRVSLFGFAADGSLEELATQTIDIEEMGAEQTIEVDLGLAGCEKNESCSQATLLRVEHIGEGTYAYYPSATAVLAGHDDNGAKNVYGWATIEQVAQ